LQKPLYAPYQFEDLEVLSYLRHHNRHAIFFNHFCVGDGLCRVANSLAGPWRPPPRELLLPRGNVVFRFCEWKDRTLLYHWLMTKADWPRRGGAGAVFYALPSPKEVEWDGEGNPTLKPFSGWSRYHRGKPLTISATSFKPAEGDRRSWTKTSNAALKGTAIGQIVAAHAGEFDHFIAELQVQLDSGRAAGIVLRGDATLDVATFLRLDYEQQAIELHKWDFWDSSLRRFKVVQPTLLQSIPAKLVRGLPIRVRILACAEYVEVCLDGIVHLCAATYKAKQGRFAFVVENGRASFCSLNIQPIRVPEQP
jgi:hypothetical protein